MVKLVSTMKSKKKFSGNKLSLFPYKTYVKCMLNDSGSMPGRGGYFDVILREERALTSCTVQLLLSPGPGLEYSSVLLGLQAPCSIANMLCEHD